MEEVIDRWAERLDESTIPDVLLIDGGQLQLNAAYGVLKNHQLDQSIQLLAISKGEKRKSGEEQLHIHGRKDSLRLEDLPLSMRFWTHLRDESHRTAISFNRKRTTQARVKSSFLGLPGVGPANAKILRKHFGTVERLMDAEQSDVDQVEGLSKALKAKLKALLEALKAKE